MTSEQIDVARQVDILATARRFVALKRQSASEWTAPCPKCGGRDRFSINLKKQVWNCRGCGKGGDVIGLVQHALGVSFGDAVDDLAGEEARLQAAPRQPDPKDDKGQSGKRAGYGYSEGRWRVPSPKPTCGKPAPIKGHCRLPWLS
jgi:DNA primase